MSVNIKVTGGLNIEWGQIDPKVTGGLTELQHSFIFCKGSYACYTLLLGLLWLFYCQPPD